MVSFFFLAPELLLIQFLDCVRIVEMQLRLLLKLFYLLISGVMMTNVHYIYDLDILDLVDGSMMLVLFSL